MQKELLVLAKSQKPGGFCVAGVEIEKSAEGQRNLTSNWIRPVVDKPGEGKIGSIPYAACEGFFVFDVINVELAEHCPEPGQPENWLWSGADLNKVVTIPNHDILGGLANHDEDIWFDDHTHRDDQISLIYEHNQGIDRSLMMVQPEQLSFKLELQDENKKKIFASFIHKGKKLEHIPVTDPILHRLFARQFPTDIGESVVKTLKHGDRYWLTMSLTPRFTAMECHYVLVAAVIDQTGYLNRNYR